MSKIPYAVIVINISADKKKVNGPDEIHLSNEVDDLIEMLQKWIKKQSVNFNFEVTEQDEARV